MIGMRAGLGGSRGFDEVLGRLPLMFGFMMVYVLLANPIPTAMGEVCSARGDLLLIWDDGPNS